MTHILLPDTASAPPLVRLPAFLTDSRPVRGLQDPALALARAADLAGLAGVVVPLDPEGPEALVTAAALLRATRHVEVVASFPTDIATPQYVAKLSASLQRFSGGRLGWLIPADDPGRAQFLAAARRFWHSPEGLKPPLSETAFPVVYNGSEPFVSVGYEPGEVFTLASKEVYANVR